MIQVKDKTFRPYISYQRIKSRTRQLADTITKDYKDKDPVIVGILNGSLYFLADLSLEIEMELDLSLVRYQSYEGMQSSGKFNVSLPLEEKIKGRHILLVEDIVDTGRTLGRLQEDLQQFEPLSVEIVTLLLKPDVFSGDYPVKYVGFEIPERFVVGYGLDYDGRGRNLRDIYVLAD